MKSVLYIGIDYKTNGVYYFGYEYEDSTKRSNNSPSKYPATTIGYDNSKGLKYANITNVIYNLFNNDNLIDNIVDMYKFILNKYDDIFINILSSEIEDVFRYIFRNESSTIINSDIVKLPKELLTKAKSMIDNNHISAKYLRELNPIVLQINSFIIEMIDENILTGELIISGKNYWKKFEFKHPYLVGNFLVIDRDNFIDDNGKYNLYSVKYPSAEEISRKLVMVNETLVIIDNLPEEILNIINEMNDFLGSEKRLYLLDLNTINDGITLRLLKDFNVRPKRITKYNVQYILKGLQNNRLAYTIYPPGLSNKLSNSIHTMLEDEYNELDITNLIYTTNDKGKTIIRAEIPTSKHVLNIETEYGKVIVMLGVDTFTRNIFKKLESKNTRVHLRYKRVDNLIIYHTYIESELGIAYSHSPYNSRTIARKKRS